MSSTIASVSSSGFRARRGARGREREGPERQRDVGGHRDAPAARRRRRRGPPRGTAAPAPIIPPTAASAGSAAARGRRSSPTVSSRLISIPTTRKNRVISPSFTQNRRSVPIVTSPDAHDERRGPERLVGVAEVRPDERDRGGGEQQRSARGRGRRGTPAGDARRHAGCVARIGTRGAGGGRRGRSWSAPRRPGFPAHRPHPTLAAPRPTPRLRNVGPPDPAGNGW